MADRNVTIVLPERLIEALDLIAKEVGVSRSQVIRRACVRYLPQINKMVEESKPGNWADELFYLVGGPPVKRTGDDTDEAVIDALNAMRERLKAEKAETRTQKKRAGRPRTKGDGDA